TLQGASSIDDSSKWRTPWFWHNQPDNFGLPATADATLGVPYPPLAIESATIVAHNQIDIVFNREVRSVQSVADASNWAIYIDDRQLTGISEANGYNWKSIRLQTNCNVNFLTGAVTNSANRLDNGKPYGRYFTGFSQRDIEERKMSAGGWIYNFQQPGENALDFGQFISLQKAMDVYGAGARNAKIEVAYIGTDDACDWDGNILAKNLKHGIDKFEPWIGHAYRSPLTGVYIYLDTAVQNRYDAKTVAIAAAMHYEAHLQNNASITYPKSAGGDDFPASANQAWNVPVFYDRVGQRIADGAVADNGGMLIAAGSNLGNHPGMQPQSGALRGSSIGDSYRIEGWGISVLNSTVFQTEDVLVMRDYNLCRHRNESLIMHEAGHGIDSYAPAYAQNIYNDISAAHATATNALNGARWRDVDNVSAYCGARGEYASTLCAVYAGIMREQMMGINDGTWTPINTRSELYRYDPYGFEVFKRIFYTGELYLWYENKIGDPAYRVMPGDWEILRDTYPEFSHWQSENDLIQWGYSIPQTARRNPYMEARNGLPGRSQLNNAVRWVSWNVPDIWAPEPYKAPSNPLYPNNKYDFAGSSPYFSIPDPADPDGLQPLKNQVHPFARPGGVPKPKRPAELEALAKPLQGIITDNYAQILSRPVLVQFGFENYDGKITRDNAQTSFELQVNGKYTHFYLWEFKETAPGVATVTVRLDWPLEEGDIVAVSQPNPLIGLLGDIDGDGLITPEDAMTLLQMYVDLIPWTSRALLLGDINGDGIVDPIDAALILRLVVGG
ncbi:MAG: dockerin type I repeat-containing protein, partial [Clostridiales bacterium]|nr:dockerin type I repeat-containing protein [Clostridiales bacterium]